MTSNQAAAEAVLDEVGACAPRLAAMCAAAFDYVRAGSFGPKPSSCCRPMETRTRVIAGGQSLVPMMTLGWRAPTVLVDIGGAAERTIESRRRRL